MVLDSNDDHVKSEAFKVLNDYLCDRTTLGGTRITEADKIMFESIFKSYATLSYAEKETFLNLSRWISYLQSDDEIIANRSRIQFSRNRLYN